MKLLRVRVSNYKTAVTILQLISWRSLRKQVKIRNMSCRRLQRIYMCLIQLHLLEKMLPVKRLQ